MNRTCALFPILALAQMAAALGQTPTSNVLIMLQDQTQRDPVARSADQAVVHAHLAALGASRVVRYNAINALAATLAPLTADRLAADPKVAHILSLDNASSRPVADLLRRMDGAAQASPGRVVSAGMPDGDFPPAGPLSQLVDRLIDQLGLTVLLHGGSGTQANAITVGPAAVAGMQKPDFIGSDSGRNIENALARLTQMGVTSALARKALVINAAGSTSGWSAESGWGSIQPDLFSSDSSQPSCVDQEQNAGRISSTCFTGAITTTQDYEIKSASPAKISVVWNRSFAGDGTPYSRNLEIHVYDRAHQELASATSQGGNVQQVTAQSDTGLMVRVQLTQPVDSSEPPQEFALVSSVSASAAPRTCGMSNSISPGTMNFPSQGGTQSVTISVDPGCNWQLGAVLTGMDIFANPAQTSGIGPATVAVTAAANPFSVQLTEHMVLMPDGFLGPYTIVTQDAGTAVKCSYTAATSGTIPIAATGGTAGLSITASPSTCTSSASAGTATWLTLSPASGTGNWSPVLTASPNVTANSSSSSRSATVNVSGTTSGQNPPFGQNFTITQSGLQCTFTLPATPFHIPASGIPQSSPQSFAVAVSSSACQLTASSTSSFLTVVNDGVVQTGKTSYTVQYWAGANTNTASRPAYIQAGGQTYAGEQDGKPQPPPPPPPPTFDATVAADDVFSTNGALVNLKPGDLVVKEDGKALITNLTGDPRFLVVHGLDPSKTYTLTLTVAGYTISNNPLKVSNAKKFAFFDAYANAESPKKVVVDVKDFLSAAIPDVLITLTANDGSIVSGRTDASGKWTGYRKGTAGITYTATADLAGYTFKVNPQNVTGATVTFNANEFIGKVVLDLQPTVVIGPSDLSDLIAAINIQFAPAAAAQPTQSTSGNKITWTVPLDPAKTYAATFSSSSTKYNVLFPSSAPSISQKKPDANVSAQVKPK
jgi:hypothetical protein